jgi:hypothetical protein
VATQVVPPSRSTRNRVPSLAHAWPVACGLIVVKVALRSADVAVLIVVLISVLAERMRALA